MNLNLTTKPVFISQVQPQPLPVQSFTFPKPLSYEFRVAEHVDEEGNIIKVGLQYTTWEHDEFGVGTLRQTWTDVPRVKLLNGIPAI